MIAILQRVDSCKIMINDEIHSKSGRGLLAYVGLEINDSDSDVNFIAHKIINLRIFNDNRNKMNYSVKDIDGDIMVVRQFTLCANLERGLRPSFTNAMPIDSAAIIFKQFVEYIALEYKYVYSGIFQSEMLVDAVNNGPSTFIIRSNIESN